MSKLLTSPPLYTHTDIWEDRVFAGKAHRSANAFARRIWWFCAKDFRKYFDVLLSATRVWLEFHSTPAPDRYKATACYNVAYLDGESIGIRSHVVKMIVRLLKRTDCYVRCIYE